MGSNQSKLGEGIASDFECRKLILAGITAEDLHEAYLKKKQQEEDEELAVGCMAYHNQCWDIIEVSGMDNMFV